MALSKIKFNHEGGPIKIKIAYQGLVAASYTYTLWEADSNDVVDSSQGNNQNPMDDEYELPSPASSNIKRLIDVHSTVLGMYDNADEGNYKVVITIIQDGKEISKNTQPQPAKPIGNNVVAHKYYALLV